MQAAEEQRRALPPLSESQLARLRKGNVDFDLDVGAMRQVTELVEMLDRTQMQLEMEYRNDPETFEQLLTRRNITAATESGRATLIQLEVENGQKIYLKLISLANVHGEPVDILFTDLLKFNSESLIFQKFVAHRMIYEPVDIAKSDFGRSLLLVDTDLRSPEATLKGLENKERTAFFPRGYNLRAWLKATFHKPSLKNLATVSGLVNTGAQCAGAFVACTLSNHIGLSNTPWEVPVTLNAGFSSIITYFFDSYGVLNGEGRQIKRFAFNFVATSMSFIVILNYWTHGPEYFNSFENWAWMLGNALASNVLRVSVDNYFLTKQQIGLITPKQSKWHRQLFYSLVPNQLRLGALMAESASKSAANGDNAAMMFFKILIKSSYIGVAAIAERISLQRAEHFAAKAKTDPKFAQKANISDSINRAAQLRKAYQERLAKFRDLPGNVVSLFSGERVDHVNHKRVSALFKRWMNTRIAYLYRLEAGSEIPVAELDLYRAAFIDDMVELAIKSIKVRDFTTRLADRSQVENFQRTSGTSQRRLISEKYDQRYFWTGTTVENDAIHEYADFVMQTSDTMARKLNDPKNASLTMEDRSKLVGLIDDMVANFETIAPKVGRHFVEHDLSEIFGVNAVKGVEHFKSRLTMWRFLYTMRSKGGLMRQIPQDVKTEFVQILNQRDLYDIESWTVTNHNRYTQSSAMYQNEIREVTSLARELKRRIDYKLAKLKLHEPVDESDLTQFKDELLAFHALKNYQNRFESRWPSGAHPSQPPEAFWSYAMKRGDLHPDKKPRTLGQLGCVGLLRRLGNPWMM